ncbi:hypothetical protein [Agrococcus sp. Marseille-P2731]|uniref:hypothetical protein n=1 Tax=Agrococcus sp. Marseille-P2731 TaxID=1841862 RepID=UPI000930FFD5|nr:hypothetical protein [Agrococcus sp. Marseille-P2731]
MDPLVRDLSRFAKYPVHEFDSLGALLATPPRGGVSTIGYNGGPLDILFLDRGAETTIVVFHAAVAQSVSTMPVFNAVGATANLNANVLSISDPSLDRGVRLGWHVGNEAQPLQQDLPAVIRHFRAASTGRQHLVLFGASGGGFASIVYSAHFPDSLALVLNPQTDISRFYPVAVREYVGAAWPGVSTVQEVPALITCAAAHASGVRSTIAYVQNLGDANHLDNHMKPWLETLGEDRAQVWTLLGEWGEGHRPPPSETTRDLLAMAADAGGDWPAALAARDFLRGPTAESVRALERARREGTTP